MINGRNFFDQLLKENLITHANNRKIATGQGGDYTTSYFLDYIHSKTVIK